MWNILARAGARLPGMHVLTILAAMDDFAKPTDPVRRDGQLAAGFFTASLPGVGGRIKQACEDFQVTEVPLYAPCGEGTHTYFGLWKRGMDTKAAIRRVADRVGANARDFGVAGLKDARAVTEQAVSIEHLDAERLRRLEALDTPDLKVTWVSRHTNKLKAGHLAANRFRLRLRELTCPPDEALRCARAILDELSERGAPNYFGPQRFGMRGDNWRLGLALVHQEWGGFLDVLLGGPRPEDNEAQRRARACYDKGDLEGARDAWPGRFHGERKALNALLRQPDRPEPAVRAAADKFLKRFTVNALQSAVFNRILDARLEALDSVDPGDLAVKTAGSGCFTVEAERIDQERRRAAAFEISATAPLFGSRTDLAGGAPGELERAVLAGFGLDREDFKAAGRGFRGERRPIRFPLEAAEADVGDDEQGGYLEVAFSAPTGCYATSVTRELIK